VASLWEQGLVLPTMTALITSKQNSDSIISLKKAIIRVMNGFTSLVHMLK